MFKGTDYRELSLALGMTKEQLDTLDELDANTSYINQFMYDKHLPLFVQYLEAHIEHLEKCTARGSHIDYIPVYKHLLELSKDDDPDMQHFSFFQLYGVMFPLMWC